MTVETTAEPATLRRTPLHSLHRGLNARMVAFAGYDMPVQYPAGIIAEHTHTRTRAGLFDVSHMGQVMLAGAGAALALERLVPADIQGLAPGRMRYGLLTNDRGGIIDDLIVANLDGEIRLVVNAGRKDIDIAHLRGNLPAVVAVVPDHQRALIALQGPSAAAVIARHVAGADALGFMAIGRFASRAGQLIVSRSGYTGEDGFEISVAADAAVGLAEALLAEAEVAPVGLGARDSLRLEAGLCLYGQDIDETTTPIEAGLAWTIAKRRREDKDFAGAQAIMRQLADGPSRRRVGIRPDGPAPARAHTPVMDAAGASLGEITSGGFGPTVGGPVAMGYVAAHAAAADAAVVLDIRNRKVPARVAALPFVPHRYVKTVR